MTEAEEVVIVDFFLRLSGNVTNYLDVMLSESEASALSQFTEADSSPAAQNDLLPQSPSLPSEWGEGMMKTQEGEKHTCEQSCGSLPMRRGAL